MGNPQLRTVCAPRARKLAVYVLAAANDRTEKVDVAVLPCKRELVHEYSITAPENFREEPQLFRQARLPNVSWIEYFWFLCLPLFIF